MNPAKVIPEDYIQFLIATPKSASAAEAERVHTLRMNPPAHDAFSRLLNRLEPDPENLWKEAKGHVNRKQGVLVLDDTVLDKPYAKHIELLGWHWSGKHDRIVKGINLVSLVWTNGDRIIPCDYRIYHDPKQATKNDHFRAMLDAAQQRGFQPECVLFDNWYASLKNLKHLKKIGWNWLTRLRGDRLVNLNHQGLRPLSQTEISADGTVVWLKGYGLIRVFKIAAHEGGIEYWASNDLNMSRLDRERFSELSWSVETYHRTMKQCTEVEGCSSRSERAQRNHIEFALRAYLRLEYHFFVTGISCVCAKFEIIRDAVRRYVLNPTIKLQLRNS